MILIQDPVAILVYLLTLIGLIYWLNEQAALAGLFKYLPTVIWIYFLPMFSTTLGILPESSILYDWINSSDNRIVRQDLCFFVMKAYR